MTISEIENIGNYEIRSNFVSHKQRRDDRKGEGSRTKVERWKACSVGAQERRRKRKIN